MFNKTAKAIIFIAVVSSLFACKGKNNQVEIKPIKTTVQGYLSDYLEVEDGTYQIGLDQNTIPSWIVKVKIKAIKAYTAPDYGLKDGNDGPLSLDLYDDKGTPLTGLDNLKSDYQDDSKLLDILTKGTGDTWVSFSKYTDYGVNKLPDNTAGFTIGSAQVEQPPSSGNNSSGNNNDTSANSLNGVQDLIGKVLTYPVEMKLTIDDKNVKGTVTYTKFNTVLNLDGTIDDDQNISLNEYDKKGNKTGSYYGKYTNGIFEGQWKNPDESKMLPFKLSGGQTTIASTPSTGATEENTSENDNTQASPTSNKDYDKMLDDYEDYCNHMLSLVKKIKAGDTDALSDYSGITLKYYALTKDLATAQTSNSLSVDQINRMVKIEQKVLTAAAEIEHNN